MTDLLMFVKEVAEELRVTPQSVTKMIRRGELKGIKVGDKYRIRRSVLDAYLNRSDEQ